MQWGGCKRARTCDSPVEHVGVVEDATADAAAKALDFVAAAGVVQAEVLQVGGEGGLGGENTVADGAHQARGQLCEGGHRLGVVVDNLHGGHGGSGAVGVYAGALLCLLRVRRGWGR